MLIYFSTNYLLKIKQNSNIDTSNDVPSGLFSSRFFVKHDLKGMLKCLEVKALSVIPTGLTLYPPH